MTAYDRVPTYTTTTTWGGWSMLSRKCLTCRHFFTKAGAPVCTCASRTVSHTGHGIKCLSYKEVSETAYEIKDGTLREAAATDELMDEKLAGIGYAKVVRCRDCKHYTEDEAEYYHYCGSWCEQVEPDGFCSWGERRGA